MREKSHYNGKRLFAACDSSIKAELSLAAWQLMFPRLRTLALANDKKRRNGDVPVQKLFLRNAGAKEFWQRRPNYTQEVEVIMRQLFLTNTRSLFLSLYTFGLGASAHTCVFSRGKEAPPTTYVSKCAATCMICNGCRERAKRERGPNLI